MDPADEVVERQQIRFSVQTVSFAADDAFKGGKTYLFYSDIVDGDHQRRPCVLRKHLSDIVRILQNKYQGRAVVSRTPGGIVLHRI